MTAPLPAPSLSLVRPSTVVDLLQRWAVSSQQTARRNAMLGATECAARRAVRLDVDTYLASAAGPAASGATATATGTGLGQIATPG
ncbi:hypothetical protein [Nocardioides alcanivorans]|uniref:hypothetical protein n=1 Tax=Nocardioides alcanivorans TaxID=2897352 RepID=UPI001F1F29FE|nr:hypothetical protein [Nocardioides alcanivorans]